MDDVRFWAFTRDLARRHRRPRRYPAPPAIAADALEQLCGVGGPADQAGDSGTWPLIEVAANVMDEVS